MTQSTKELNAALERRARWCLLSFAAWSALEAATNWRLYFKPIGVGSIAGTARPFPLNIVYTGMGVVLIAILLRVAWRAGNGFARAFWFVVAGWFVSGWFVTDRSSATTHLLNAVKDSTIACVFFAFVVFHVRRPFELHRGWLSGNAERALAETEQMALAEREQLDTRRASRLGLATPVLGLPLGAVTAVNPMSAEPYLFTSSGLARVLVADLLLSLVLGGATLAAGMLLTMGDRSSPAGRNLVAYGAACLAAWFGFLLLGSQLSVWFGLLD